MKINSITYPVKKTFFVANIKVDVIKLNYETPIGIKIHLAGNHEQEEAMNVGNWMMNYLASEDLLNEEFLLSE